MSQIAVALLPRDAVTAEACLEAMLAAMEDCPCDRVTRHRHGDLSMACRLDALTPEAASEELPRLDASGTRLLTGDLRLDARESLARAVQLSAAHPDGSLLLAACVRWGREAPQQVLGDYAYVLADLEDGSLTCVRDALGIRPLYFAPLQRLGFPSGVLLASDPRAVRAALALREETRARLDPAMVTAFLRDALSWHPTDTFTPPLQKVPPGHRLEVRRSSAGLTLHLERWWLPERIPVTIPPEQAVERLAPLVEEAVRDRLRTPHPVAVHLSGGLDSSLVAAHAVHQRLAQGRPRPTACTWTPPATADLLPPEVAMLHAVEDHLGLQAHPLCLGPHDVQAFVALDPADLPVENTMLYEDLTQRWAAQQGIRLILTGWGGDEAVSHPGGAFYLDLLLQGRWRDLRRALAAAGLHSPRQVLGTLLRPLLRYPRWGLRATHGTSVLSPWAARLPRRRAAQGHMPLMARAQRIWRVRCGSLSARTESYAAFGARHRVHYAHPLLDRRIVETVLGLDALAFRSGREARHLMRRLAAPWLPAEVLANPLKLDDTRIAAMQEAVLEGVRPLVPRLCRDVLPAERARFVDLHWLRSRMQNLVPEQTMRVLEALQLLGAGRGL